MTLRSRLRIDRESRQPLPRYLPLEHAGPKRLEVFRAEVVPAGQGLGRDDVGHHLLVQGVHDRPVKALGNGHDHEGLVHKLPGRQPVADVAQSAGCMDPRKPPDDRLDGINKFHPEGVVQDRKSVV